MKCPLISVDGVRHLIIARFVQCAEIEPDFRQIRVNSNGSRIGIQGVVELIDVVIEYSNRTPEGGILAISINRPLIRFVRLIKITRRHISPSK